MWTRVFALKGGHWALVVCKALHARSIVISKILALKPARGHADSPVAATRCEGLSRRVLDGDLKVPRVDESTAHLEKKEDLEVQTECLWTWAASLLRGLSVPFPLTR